MAHHQRRAKGLEAVRHLSGRHTDQLDQIDLRQGIALVTDCH